jgi:hypothetical protein
MSYDDLVGSFQAVLIRSDRSAPMGGWPCTSDIMAEIHGIAERALTNLKAEFLDNLKSSPSADPKITTRCPSCRGRHLFIGSGGHLTCSSNTCKNPSPEDVNDKLMTELEKRKLTTTLMRVFLTDEKLLEKFESWLADMNMSPTY